MGSESESDLESVFTTFDLLTTAVAVFDAGKKLRFFNQAFLRFWDLDKAFLDSAPDHALFLERLRVERKIAEQPEWRRWRDNLLSAYSSTDTQEHWWHLPDGRTVRVVANREPNGGVIWAFENLTERIDLESRYQTAVRVQGETLDNLSEGVIVFGADGRVRLSNPSFAALWGLAPSVVAPGVHISQIGKVAKDKLKESPWEDITSVVTGFDDNRTDRRGQVELYSNLVLRYAIVHLPNGQVMVTFVDITDSVSLQRALKDETQVKPDTALITNNSVDDGYGLTTTTEIGLPSKSADEAEESIVPGTTLSRNKPAVSFAIVGGKIRLEATESWSYNIAKARTYHKRVLRILDTLNGYLERTDSEPALLVSLKELRDLLRLGIDQVEPDHLRLASRSVTAMAKAYAHPEAKWELSAGTVRGLFELAEVLLDLQSCAAPLLVENERAIRELELGGADLSKAKEANDLVGDIVIASSDLFAPSAVEIFERSGRISNVEHDESVMLMIEGERALVAENLALTLAREIEYDLPADKETSQVVVTNETAKKERWALFREQFLEKLNENLATDLGGAAKEAILEAVRKPLPTIASVAALVAGLSLAGMWVTGGLAIAAAWIVYRLRNRGRP